MYISLAFIHVHVNLYARVNIKKIEVILHGITRDAIENTFTVANKINATHGQRMMGRVDVISSNIERLSCNILIGSLF